ARPRRTQIARHRLNNTISLGARDQPREIHRRRDGAAKRRQTPARLLRRQQRTRVQRLTPNHSGLRINNPNDPDIKPLARTQPLAALAQQLGEPSPHRPKAKKKNPHQATRVSRPRAPRTRRLSSPPPPRRGPRMTKMPKLATPAAPEPPKSLWEKV